MKSFACMIGLHLWKRVRSESGERKIDNYGVEHRTSGTYYLEVCRKCLRERAFFTTGFQTFKINPAWFDPERAKNLEVR